MTWSIISMQITINRELKLSRFKIYIKSTDSMESKYIQLVRRLIMHTCTPSRHLALLSLSS